jgi:predicted O-methyltransferase YrrM
MKILQITFRYIKYLFNSINKYSLHSPYIYSFVTNVIFKKTPKEETGDIHHLRSILYQNNQYISILDFGEGSSINKKKERKVKDIAKNSSKNSKYGELLMRIVQFLKPKNIIELGTSFGISTCYLSRGNPEASILTFEGCPETAKLASNNFKKLDISNIKIIVGDFKKTLKDNLYLKDKTEFIFIDGNHNQNSTIEYFELSLNISNNKTIIIFDDIHWSSGMEKAWEYIKKSDKITTTIDLFFIGIVFLNPKLSKEDFIIRF